jgi:3D (Asp-Asp-Asp) domain-containing protein
MTGKRVSFWLLIASICGLSYGVFLDVQKWWGRDTQPKPQYQSLQVTSTGYTSRKIETDDDPFTAAWGNTLRPGMKAVAVSRDLLRMGLTRGTRIHIEGLPGTYIVLDKMNRRWKKRVDVYFGMDVKAARQWGKRKVTISWVKPREDNKMDALPFKPRNRRAMQDIATSE